MNKFETELLNGNFVISNCINCKQVVWPPSNYCNICHNETKWSNSKQVGKIIEFSKKNSSYFGMIELKEKIRVMGEIFSNNEPKIGQNVTMKAFFDTRPHYSFTVENN